MEKAMLFLNENYSGKKQKYCFSVQKTELRRNDSKYLPNIWNYLLIMQQN